MSNYFHYFSHKFDLLGLKKLITTCYKNQKSDLFLKYASEQTITLEYDGFRDGEEIPRIEEISIQRLAEDGIFRNAEYVELLKQADIVATNPPFSLYKAYVAQLIEHSKKFVIVSHQNTIT